MKYRIRGALAISALFVVCSLVLPAPSFAQAPSTSAVCNQPGVEPIMYVDLPGNPFMAAPTHDGCWVFVSLSGLQTGIAVLRRAGGKVSLARVVAIQNHPAGMVLTHDGSLLIAADDDGVAILDVRLLISGQGEAVVGYLRHGPADVPSETRRFIASQFGDQAASQTRTAGSIYVNATADDRFLFVSDEWVQTITVINLEKARRSNFAPDLVLGKIPVGVAPIALTFSPDERYLYTTSEAGLPSYGWPLECKREGQGPLKAEPGNPQGAIVVVDVAKAKLDPRNAVIAKVAAGCTPVRLAVSPKGDVAFVTARNNNALLAFNTSKLIRDSAHALIGSVPVGVSPVGVAVIDGNHNVLVTNSNRFSGDSDNNQSLTLIDGGRVSSGAAAVLGTIPAGAFPRELTLTADSRTLLVTNYNSKTLEVVDLAKLPLVFNETHKKP